MPSIQAKMISGIFKLAGVNKMLDKRGEDFEKLLENYKEKQKRPLKIPYGKMKNFDIQTKVIGETTCYTIAPKGEVPLPAKLVLQSPGLQVPPSESQKAMMEKRKREDVMIPPSFFDHIAPVLVTEEESYLLSPLLYDLTGFPEIDVFYGTREVMIAYLDDFKNPVIDFNGNHTYIQSKGINQDFGVYDSPDEMLRQHHQVMSPVKAFAYRHLGRHLMNRNVRRIRGVRGKII